MKRILKLTTDDSAVVRDAKKLVSTLATQIYTASRGDLKIEEAVDEAIQLFDSVCGRIKSGKR